MTKEQSQKLDTFLNEVKTLREVVSHVVQENQKIQKKLDDKYMPVNFEEKILSSLQSSLNDAIKSVLCGYNNPLSSLVNEVIKEHNNYLKEIITSSFGRAVKTEDFKEGVYKAFVHKIAKSLIGGQDGAIDKVVHELKQDPKFRAELTLVVATMVENYRKEN